MLISTEIVHKTVDNLLIVLLITDGGVELKGKSGVPMSGIINTRGAKHKAIARKKDDQKLKRASVCLGCEHSNGGFCTKHKGWCGQVNYICAGTSDPYEHKLFPAAKPKK